MRKTSTLITLCALALPAALVPSTATAMDDNGGAGECRSVPWAPPGAGWNGTEFCTLTDGSAGGGGGGGATGGDGSGSGGGTVGEVIVIVDPYSPPKSTSPLCPNPRLCVPGQSGGGRPLGIDGDGPSRGGPKGRGGGSGSGETKGSSKRLTKEECAKLKMNDAPFSARLGELNRQIRDWEEKVQNLGDREKDVSRGLFSLRAQLPDMSWWALVDRFRVIDPPTPGNFIKRLLKHYAFTVEIRTEQEEISRLEAKRLSSFIEVEKLNKELNRLLAEHRPTENALRDCWAAYGRPSR
jgi:hypothetical protein